MVFEGYFVRYAGDFGDNWFWATNDEDQIPRRINEGGSRIADYDTTGFQNQTIPFPDGIFALPSYCNQESPSNCPLQSMCGKLRSKTQEK